MPDGDKSAMPGKAAMVAGLVIVAAAAAAGLYATRSSGQQEQGNQAQAKQERTVDEAARTGMATLRELATAADPRVLGLTSREEAGQARLGQKYDVFFIRLDALRNYRPEAGAASLLVASPDSVFAVMVGDDVRSSMTVTRTDRGYVASEFGAAARMQASMAARPPAAGDFIVRVPALGLQFIGSRSAGALTLTAIAPDPRLRLEPGRAMPAEALLQQLVPLARAYNGEPM